MKTSPSAPLAKHAGAWILLTAVLVLFGGLLFYTLYQEYLGVESQETDRLETQVRVVDDNVISQLVSLKVVLDDFITQLPQTWSVQDEPRFSALLKTVADAMPGVRGMSVLDATGHILVTSTADRSFVGHDFSYRDYFSIPAHHPDLKMVYVSPPFKTVKGTYTMSISKVIPNRTGGFGGVITATLAPPYFSVLLDSVRYKADMRVTLAHIDGVDFLSAPVREGLAGTNFNMPGSLFERHKQSGRTVSVYKGLLQATNENRLLVNRTIVSNQIKLNKTLVVGASRDLSVLFSAWNQRVLAYCVVYGSLVATAFFVLFLTQRRQRRFELIQRENMERFKLATEAAQVGVWEVGFETAAPEWEDTMYSVFGVSKEDSPDSLEVWNRMLFPEDRSRVASEMAEIYDTGKPFNTRFRIRWNDGSVRTIRAAGKMFESGEGRAKRLIGINQDITEIVEAHQRQEELIEQLKERTKEAEQANQSKSEFLANMSHEIRTPMNAVLGLLSLLLYTDLNKRQLDYVRKAEMSAQTLLALLNDILDFSKVEAGKMELEKVTFHLSDVFRSLSVILGTLIREKDLEVLFQISSTVPHALKGDPLRLQQVLLNLAGNAVKFTERGEVVLAMEAVGKEKDSVLLRFSVSDTGIGIAPDMLEEIFSGFVQAEASTVRRFGGTGLGLAISRRLVRLMGGELEVTSQLGQGSTFYFTVPFAVENASKVKTASQKELASMAALRTLVIEDNPIARDVLVSMVKSLGWPCESAEGGSEGLSRLKVADQEGRPFELILIDWKMPDLDGWDTAVEIRTLMEQTKTPLIVMVTAHGREVLAERLSQESSPFDSFLVKPITPSMLFDSVVELVSEPKAVPSEELLPSSRDLEGSRLLIVEDNAMNQLIARGLLEKEGAQVVIASSGEQALKLLEDGGFDLVLMDIQMPVMDGYEVTRRIRETFGSQLPIIAMTANVLAGEKEKCLQAGMNDHIGKPLDMKKVKHVLREYLFKAPADETGTFDLDAALARLENDKELLSVICREFIAEYADFIPRLETLRAQGDTEAVLRALHSLKGLVATLGAVSLAEAARRLEKNVEEKTDGPRMLEHLKAELEHAFTFLEASFGTTA